jgi:hypothetical protein
MISRTIVEIFQEAESQGKHLIFFTGPSPQYKANAAVLVSKPVN